MSNDALRRMVKKNKLFTSPNPKLEQSKVSMADGGLATDVSYTSDDPQAEVMARAQAPVTNVLAEQAKQDYANRLTYQDAVAAAKGDPQAQAKVHEKSLAWAGTVGPMKMAGKAASAMTKPFIELEHYSHTPDIKVIDPKFSGKGFDARIRGRSSEHPQSFFYEAGTPPEAESGVGQAPHKYKARIEAEKVYDLGKDPLNLVKTAMDSNNGVLNMDMVHSLVKEKGFKGYRNTGNERLGNVVVSYEPLEVMPSGPSLPKSFSLMTAENPGAKALSPQENALKMKALKSDLQALGAKVKEVKGVYGGNQENSLMIEHLEGISPDKLEALAEKYGQESIVHHRDGANELKYVTGQNKGKSFAGKGVDFSPQGGDNYSVVDDSPFRLDFDFSKPKSTPKAPVQKPTLPPNEMGFVSKLEQTIMDKMGSSASPEHIRGMLKDVKPEELKYSGVEELLKDPNAKVSKEELLQHIKSNRPKLQEKVLRDNYEMREDPGGGGWGVYNTAAKYAQYQTPGGENYREVLMTLPASPGELNKAFDDWALKKYGDSWLDMDAAGVRKAGEEFKKIAGNEVELRNPSYRSSHWEDPNVLVHYRVKDRIDPDGKKTLFVEEIQSDWHQAGREKGYKGEPGSTPGHVSPATHYDEINNAALEKYGVGYNQLSATSQRTLVQDMQNEGLGKVPDAPFKKTWHELAMKRILKQAEEGGYDRVAWTSGQTQADRYSLSKHVGEIRYNLDSGITQIKTPDGHNIGTGEQRLNKSELANMFGKEVAEKILSKKPEAKGWVRLTGQDLKIGGEGMKGFYDKMLPDYVNKIGKQFGSKVVSSGDEHYIDLGPEMKKHIKEKGFPLFQVGGAGLIGAGAASSSQDGKENFAEGGEVSGYNPTQSDTVDPNTINYSQPPQSDIPSGPQGNINVLSPENELLSVDPSQLHEALSAGYKIPTPEEEKHYLNEAEFGTPGQQAATALEGAAEALTFGTSTGLERGLGISTPERITARRETNPGMHMAGQIGGLAASALIPVVGEANVMRAGGMGLARAAGLTGSSLVHQIGNAAVRGAFDMAVLQGGEEVSKAFASDPNQIAESALAHIGMATVMGGVFGGVAGAALNAASRVGSKVISEIDRPAMEAGTFESAVNNSGLFKESEKKSILEALRKPKKDAPEIIAASERLGAPVMEGMVSDNHLVQRAEDALINGAPTYSGLKRQEMYKEGLNKATGAVDAVLGEGSNHSKAELGNLIKSGLTFSLEEQNAPIKAMYDTLKAEHSIIPLAKNAGDYLTKDLGKLQELRLSPSSPEGAMVKRVLSEVEGLKTVDDIKAYKSILQRSVSPTASSGEKRMASVISDKLTQLEEDGIESFARKQGRPELMNLIGARKEANSKYAEFIKKIQTLSEQLGKGRVYGVQDAIHFIQDRLTPEEVTTRLFAKNNSEFLKFFSKEFPEQMSLMRDYQKGLLREEASRTGALSPKILFNKVNKLEPEVQEALFSKEELARLKDAETYIRAIPKNFNPSGTAHTSAMREFFKSPFGATMANATDYGIEKFIKLVGTSPEVRQAMELGNAIVKNEKASKRAIGSIFQAADDVALPRSADAKESDKAKIDKMVTQYTAHPEKMVDIGANNPIPEMSEAFAASAARTVQYLGSIRPDLSPKAPLDPRLPMNSAQKSDYDRALTVAANPMTVLDRIRNNTVTIKDVVALNTMYPNLYRKFSADIQNKILEKTEKGESIPYTTRMSLSTFLGQPLDSTMSPIGILGAQAQSGPQQGQQPQAGGQFAGPKKSTSSLSKLPQSYQTSEQTRESRRQKP